MSASSPSSRRARGPAVNVTRTVRVQTIAIRSSGKPEDGTGYWPEMDTSAITRVTPAALMV